MDNTYVQYTYIRIYVKQDLPRVLESVSELGIQPLGSGCTPYCIFTIYVYIHACFICI